MKKNARCKHRPSRLSILRLAVFCLVLTVAGCGAGSVRLDETSAGPQLAADPAAISLGVAKVAKTKMVFVGKGFAPQEKVMLVLHGADAATREIMVPLGFGTADDRGRFAVEVEKQMKISNLLNADVVFGEKGPIVMVSGPPVPAGAYTVKATGYQSNLEATCALTLTEASLADRVKDRIARMLGKIASE